MALTRAEAIVLAAMRHLASHPLTWWQREALERGFFQSSPLATKAIRAHFRAIVRTYGVKEEPVRSGPDIEFVDWRSVYSSSAPPYDGHSLRI